MASVFNYIYSLIYPNIPTLETIKPEESQKEEVQDDPTLLCYVKCQSAYEKLTATTLFDATDLTTATEEFEKIQTTVFKLLKKLDTLPQSLEVQTLKTNLNGFYTVSEETIRSLLSTEDSKKKKKHLPVCGIINISNNCWANSTLQLLFNTPSLHENIMSPAGSNTVRGLYKNYKKAQDEEHPIANKVKSSRLRE